MDNRQKTVDFKESNNETSILIFWLKNDKRLLQTGKIDKFIVFCLVQGKSGCVSREKWGTMPPPFQYGMALMDHRIIKASMLHGYGLSRSYCTSLTVGVLMRIDKQQVCKSAWLTKCMFAEVQNWKTASLQNVTLKIAKMDGPSGLPYLWDVRSL